MEMLVELEMRAETRLSLYGAVPPISNHDMILNEIQGKL